MNKESKIVVLDAARSLSKLVQAFLVLVLFGVLINIGVFFGTLATTNFDISSRVFTELMCLNGFGVDGGARYFLSIVNWCVLALIPIYFLLCPIRGYFLDVKTRARQGI